MSHQIKGNLTGLAPSERRRIERFFRRSLDARELVTPELAQELFRVASELRRRIGLIVSREGSIEEVVVGTRDILYLPDLGRYRLGRGRLRRLRLVFSDLSKADRDAIIPADIHTDLEKLRLDAVVSIKVRGQRLTAAYAHLAPFESGNGHDSTRVQTIAISDLFRYDQDFGEGMEQLEGELDAGRGSVALGKGPRAVLIGVYEGAAAAAQSSMAELAELARTAGVEVVDRIIQRRTIDPRTLIGKGKLEEVVLRCLALGADLLIFDTELKPAQWRVITNSTELKVIDRSMLILDIFAQRATSSDGRLQVELAQLKYNLPRLVEKDAGLSRLSGGIGGRGPGETKLEIGRRRIRDRITELEQRIEKLGEQRELRRRRRQEKELPVVALVGYTNVGKSTLFNALTKSAVAVEDKLFATLDPAQRRISIPEYRVDGEAQHHSVILTDTVGFIRHLPEELRSAFRATLEEMYQADVLVHVLDAADAEIAERSASVEGILKEMRLADKPRITVLNKFDRVASEKMDELVAELGGLPVSAVERQGLGDLTKTILRTILEARHNHAIPLPISGN